MHTLLARSLNTFRVGLLAFGLVLGSAQAVESPPLRSLEEAIETNTDDVLLPVSQVGVLTFRKCPAPCAMQSLQVDQSSKFFVGSSEVTAEQFGAFVRSKGRGQFLMVFHKPGDTVVTRLMVFGQL